MTGIKDKHAALDLSTLSVLKEVQSSACRWPTNECVTPLSLCVIPFLLMLVQCRRREIQKGDAWVNVRNLYMNGYGVKLLDGNGTHRVPRLGSGSKA